MVETRKAIVMIIDCVQDVPTSGMFMSTRSLWAEMAIDSTGQATITLVHSITLNQLKICVTF